MDYEKINYENSVNLARLTKLAWVAGFIDGEGCLYSNGGRPSLSVSQKMKEPLLRVQTILGGGTIHEYALKTPSGKNTSICNYYLGGGDLIVALKRLKPFLVVKADA